MPPPDPGGGALGEPCSGTNSACLRNRLKRCARSFAGRRNDSHPKPGCRTCSNVPESIRAVYQPGFTTTSVGFGCSVGGAGCRLARCFAALTNSSSSSCAESFAKSVSCGTFVPSRVSGHESSLIPLARYRSWRYASTARRRPELQRVDERPTICDARCANPSSSLAFAHVVPSDPRWRRQERETKSTVVCNV